MSRLFLPTTVFCFLALGATSAVFIRAAENSSAPLLLGESPERDFQLTVHARQVLAEIPGLAGLNIGIRVRRGVLTLWGPIPDRKIVFLLIARMENLKGISRVISELYIGSGGEGVQAFTVLTNREPMQLTDARTPPNSAETLPRTEGSLSRVLRMPSGLPVPGKTIGIPQPAQLTGKVEKSRAVITSSLQAQTEARLAELVRQQPCFGLIRYRLDGECLMILGGSDAPRLMEFANCCSVISGIKRIQITPQS